MAGCQSMRTTGLDGRSFWPVWAQCSPWWRPHYSSAKPTCSKERGFSSRNRRRGSNWCADSRRWVLDNIQVRVSRLTFLHCLFQSQPLAHLHQGKHSNYKRIKRKTKQKHSVPQRILTLNITVELLRRNFLGRILCTIKLPVVNVCVCHVFVQFNQNFELLNSKILESHINNQNKLWNCRKGG